MQRHDATRIESRRDALRIGGLMLVASAMMGAVGCAATEVEYQIVVDREFATQTVLETSVFASGEKFQLRITPEQDCFVYLLNRGTSGRYTMLYPRPESAGERSEAERNRTATLPTRGSFQFDMQSGTEELILCVSRKPHPALERVVRQGDADAASIERLLLALEQANRSDSSYVKTIDENRTRVCLVGHDSHAVLVSRMSLRHQPTPPIDAVADGQLDEEQTAQALQEGPASQEVPVPASSGETDAPSVPVANENVVAAEPVETRETGQYALDQAVRDRLVRVTLSGGGLDAVSLKIERRDDAISRIVIPVGTYFRSRGSAQNMISTQSATAELGNDGSASLRIRAACANFDRPEPGHGDRFEVDRLSDPVLQRLMARIEADSVSQVVAQVAIWVVTDNISRSQLEQTYRSTRYVNGVMVGRSAAASPEDIQAARTLLDSVGFKTARARLFR